MNSTSSTPRHIGQNQLTSVSHHQGIYTLENVRDFERETEHAAKQHFLTVNISSDSITGCVLYQSLFGAKKILAHYMLGFHINDPEQPDLKEIILSIEARRPLGDNYQLWKGVLPNIYDIIYIRGMPTDLLGLRNNIWKEPLQQTPLQLSGLQAQDLFSYFSHRTNEIIRKPLSYNAIYYNCLTELHKGIAKIKGGLPSWTIRTILAKGYQKFLQRRGVIS